MREPHFWTRLSSESYPTSLFAVECDSTARIDPSSPNVRHEDMTAWWACGYRIDHHAKRSDWSGGGAHAATLWKALEWSCRRQGQTWLVSTVTSRVCGLLGLWEAIEGGKVVLSGRDGMAGGGSGTAGAVLVRGGAADAPLPRQMGGRVGALPELQRKRAASPLPVGGGVAGNRGAPVLSVIEDPPTILLWRMPGMPGTIQMVDLRNYGIDCWPDPSTARERAEWALGTMERMLSHLKSRKWGSLKTTAGSQAKTILRRQYLTHSLHCHADADALALERRAYVGGRCECGRLGYVPGPVYHLDVRSMYPHVCAVSLLPATLRVRGSGALPRVRPGGETATGYLAEVEVSTEEPAYPSTAERPVVYPVGRFRTVLCGPELADALECGRVRSVGQWAEYELTPCLKAYAEALWEARRAVLDGRDPPIEQWLKRMLVCLPGKFGQTGWTWEAAPHERALGPWCQWSRWVSGIGPHRVRSLGWHVQRQVDHGWHADSVPSIAAWVCSAGRMILLGHIRAAGWPNVLYCDTDSLHTTKEGYERLVECGRIGPGALGDLRLVEVVGTGEYFGQKHYRLGPRYVCAGLPAGGAHVGPTPDAFWRVQWPKAAVNQCRRPEVEALLQSYRSAPTYSAGVVGPGGVIYPHRRENG